jgi:hypothetical protein
MVVVTDARVIGKDADNEQVELIGPGPVRETRADPRVEDRLALDPFAATVAPPGLFPQKCCYPHSSSDYSWPSLS